MALATQCPHCQTTFRVAHDQLKLRAGLVRCGYCKEIFNGIEHLLPPAPVEAATATEAVVTPDDVTDSAPPAPSTKESPASPFESGEIASSETAENEALALPAITGIDFDIPVDENAVDENTESAHAEAVPDTPTRKSPPEDSLQRMTLMDFTRELPDSFDDNADDDADETDTQELSNAEDDAATVNPQARDELDEAIEDLQRRPWRKAKKNFRVKIAGVPDKTRDAEDEPGFLKRGRRQQRLGRKLRVLFGAGSFVLLITALGQGTYLFRNQIAGFFPQLKPALIQICGAIGCHINLPAQIASVSIESSELQTLATGKDMFVLTTLLRNYSSASQEWPYMELTLNDANEKPLLRRVFKPVDYLPNVEDVRMGFAGDSERAIKLSFALSQIRASGYRVYLFYP